MPLASLLLFDWVQDLLTDYDVVNTLSTRNDASLSKRYQIPPNLSQYVYNRFGDDFVYNITQANRLELGDIRRVL